MFDIGKEYRFETLEPGDPGTVHNRGGKVLEIELPLIKVQMNGDVVWVILNTSASNFISAKLVQLTP
jgi:hypothetical protein